MIVAVSHGLRHGAGGVCFRWVFVNFIQDGKQTFEGVEFRSA